MRNKKVPLPLIGLCILVIGLILFIVIFGSKDDTENTSSDHQNILSSSDEIITSPSDLNVVREKEVSATCEEEGHYDSVAYDSLGNEISRETITIPATGHKYERGKCIYCGEKGRANTPTWKVVLLIFGVVSLFLAAYVAYVVFVCKKSVSNKFDNKKILLFCFLLFIFGVLLIIIGVKTESVEARIIAAIKEQRYADAVTIYNEEYTDNDAEGIKKALSERIDFIKQEYIDGSISYDTITKEIETIKVIGNTLISEKLSDLELFLEELTKSQEAFKVAEGYYIEDDYVNAISYYKKVIKQDSNYSIAQAHLSNASDCYRKNVLDISADFAQNEDYASAIKTIQDGLKVLPDDSNLLTKLKDYKKEQACKETLAKAEKLSEAGNIKEAIVLISDTIDDYNEDNPDLTAAYNKYCKQYENETIKNINKLLKNHEYKKASLQISEAVEFMPDSSILMSKQEEIESKIDSLVEYLPDIYPSEFEKYEGNEGDSCIFNFNLKGLPGKNNDFIRNGSIGVNEEVFSNGFEIWIARWNFTEEISWVKTVYDLNGDYNRLTGNTGLIKSYNTSDFNTTISFYGDGHLLKSYNMTPKNYKHTIKINLTNVKKLTLFVKDNKASRGGTSYALNELHLEHK